MRSLSILVFFTIIFYFTPAFADSEHQEVLQRIDQIISQYRATIRKLEYFDIDELKNDIKEMKRSLRKLRAIKVLVNRLKSSERDFTKSARETKEEVRSIYKQLAAIPLVARVPDWDQAQKRWFHLQGQSPEFLSKSQLSAHQDQLQGLLQQFRNIESEANERYQQILSDNDRLYRDLKENSWSNQLTRWKRVSRIWEKTWQRRKEEGLTASSAFEEIYSNFLKIEKDAQSQQKKALDRIDWLRDEIAKFVKLLEHVSLANRDKRWQNYNTQWVNKRDLDLTTLSPNESKEEEIDLTRLRSNLWTYKLDLEKKLENTHRDGQSLYEELLEDSWAKTVAIYPQVMERWKNLWQNKVDIVIGNANAIEKMFGSLKRIKESGQKRREKVNKTIRQFRELNGQMSNKLGKIVLAKRHPNWIKSVKTWQQLQHVPIILMTPQQLGQYQKSLAKLSNDFLVIEAGATKELGQLFVELRELYEKAKEDKWLSRVSAWQQNQEQWISKWEWKTEVSFTESPDLEKVRDELQRIVSQAQKTHKDAISQAIGLKQRCQNVYQRFQVLGELDTKWDDIAKSWTLIETQKIEALSPPQMDKYFADCIKLREEMDQLRPRLQVACIKLFGETAELYDTLLEDNWTISVKDWEQVSQDWIARRPLSSAVNIGDGELLLNFKKKFLEIARKARELKDPQFKKVVAKQQKLEEQFQSLVNITLATKNYRWKDIVKGAQDTKKVDYQALNVEELQKYERDLDLILHKIEAVEHDAQQQLVKMWKNGRKLYQLLQKNPWTTLLAQKNNISQQWEKRWEQRRTQLQLSDGDALRDIHRQMELCWPFWWRPLPPTTKIPENFFLSVKEVDISGASVPVWSPNGRFLTFQTTSQEQMAVQILDLVGGQRQTLELYDREQRWISFYSWSPRQDVLSFCARQLGFYDLYYINHAPGAELHSIPITDNPDYEKHPTWNGDTLFFIQGNDIYQTSALSVAKPLLIGNNYEFHEIDYLQTRKLDNHIEIAFCANKKANTNKAVYILTTKSVNGKLQGGEVRQISQLDIDHSALSWNRNATKIVSYTAKSKEEMGINAIDLATSQEKEIVLPGKLRMPQAPEHKFRGPQFVGQNTLICATKSSQPHEILSIVDLNDFNKTQTIDNSQYASLFQEVGNISISPNGCFMTWTYLKEGEGRKLAIAVVNFP